MPQIDRPKRKNARHKVGLRDINQYRGMLADKHGSEILEEFDTVYKADSVTNLTDIAKKYGFSKALSGQIFKSLYGMSFREARALVKKTKDPDHDISKGEKRLFVIIDVETDRKLNRFIKSRGVTKASVVRSCLADFLEGDAYSRVSF